MAEEESNRPEFTAAVPAIPKANSVAKWSAHLDGTASHSRRSYTETPEKNSSGNAAWDYFSGTGERYVLRPTRWDHSRNCNCRCAPAEYNCDFGRAKKAPRYVASFSKVCAFQHLDGNSQYAVAASCIQIPLRPRTKGSDSPRSLSWWRRRWNFARKSQSRLCL